MTSIKETADFTWKRWTMNKSPVGVLIPPFYNHQPAGIIGSRKYLEALKTAIEDALETGLGRADVFMPDGEGHYVMVKLENNANAIPVCYSDFWGTREIDGESYAVIGYAYFPDEWGKAHNRVAELESFYEKWENLHKNFTQLLLYLFLEKCPKGKGEEESYSCVELYHEFQELANRLFWKKEWQMKLPSLKEIKEFFDKLWEKAGVPDFCFRTVLYGSEDDIRACIDLSEELLEAGFKNHSLEGIGIDRETGCFRFLLKEGIPEEVKLKPSWKVKNNHLLIPIKEAK